MIPSIRMTWHKFEIRPIILSISIMKGYYIHKLCPFHIHWPLASHSATGCIRICHRWLASDFLYRQGRLSFCRRCPRWHPYGSRVNGIKSFEVEDVAGWSWRHGIYKISTYKYTTDWSHVYKPLLQHWHVSQYQWKRSVVDIAGEVLCGLSAWCFPGGNRPRIVIFHRLDSTHWWFVIDSVPVYTARPNQEGLEAGFSWRSRGGHG